MTPSARARLSWVAVRSDTMRVPCPEGAGTYVPLSLYVPSTRDSGIRMPPLATVANTLAAWTAVEGVSLAEEHGVPLRCVPVARLRELAARLAGEADLGLLADAELPVHLLHRGRLHSLSDEYGAEVRRLRDDAGCRSCSVPWFSWSLNFIPAPGSRFGMMTPVSGITTPCSSAAAIVMSFPVDPGSKASSKAWFRRAAVEADDRSLRSNVG